MTYKKLLEFLRTLPEEQLEQTVTVYLTNKDEYYPVVEVNETDFPDVLDEEHIYLEVEA